VGLGEKRGLKIKVDTRDEMLGGIFYGTADHIKKRKNQLRRRNLDLSTIDVKCIEVNVGIFEHLLRIVINLPYKHSVKIILTVSNFSFFIAIHNAIVADSNSSISVTIQNYTYVRKKVFSQ
jgi:hypothetical protein